MSLPLVLPKETSENWQEEHRCCDNKKVENKENLEKLMVQHPNNHPVDCQLND